MTIPKQTQAKAEAEKTIKGIKRFILWIWLFIALILSVTAIVDMAKETRTEKRQVGAIRLACPAGMQNSHYVKIPGQNKLSAAVSIPPGCDFRVMGDVKKKIHMKTFPDEEIHAPELMGVKKVHKNNPEAIAFFSHEEADVTVVFFPLNTLPR